MKMDLAGFRAAILGVLLVAGPACAQPSSFGPWGIELSARDTTVRPGDDFGRYVYGSWFARVVIPPDAVEVGVHAQLFDSTDARIRALIEQDARNPSNPTAQKIGALYNSFMDEARVEALDDRPLRPKLDAIRKAGTKERLAELMGRAQFGFGYAFFSTGVRVDPEQPDRHALRLSQSGLGLGDRSRYRDHRFQSLRRSYTAYAESILTMIRWPHAAAEARAIVAAETRIAQVSWSASDRRDRRKIYNPTSLDALSKLAPGFPWRAFLRGAGVGAVTQLIVSEKSAFPAIAAIYDSLPLATLKAWEAFHTVDRSAPYLSRRFVDAQFAFRGRTLRGLEANDPRWQRGVILFDDRLAEAVGREYVTRYFPPADKQRAEALVADLRSAMAERIDRLDWMSPATRAAAQLKLSRLIVMVGYPTEWRDYSKVKIDARDLYGNLERAIAADWALEVERLPQPVDRRLWTMPPHTPDAQADLHRLSLVFGAAYFQPPYYDPNADMAVNYGAIGGIIGHEITHQFDDQGRTIDATGRLRDWWTPEDAVRFTRVTDDLVRQFDAFQVVDSLHVNGRQTLGENIADLGGLVLALDAYRRSLHGAPAPVIDGFTGEQRLFLAWAQMWRTKEREQVMRERALSDVHAPARYRASGPPQHVDTWYEAFGVRPTDRQYLSPERRVRIW